MLPADTLEIISGSSSAYYNAFITLICFIPKFVLLDSVRAERPKYLSVSFREL